MSIGTDFASFADALPGIVWSARADSRVDFVNRCWRDYAGHDRLQADGAGLHDAVHAQDLRRLLDAWQRMAAMKAPASVDVRLRRHDGAYRWFQLSSRPICDDEGILLRWCGLGTERGTAPLAESDTANAPAVSGNTPSTPAPPGAPALHAIVETIPMTAWSTEPDGYCDFINQRWLDYAGMTMEQAVGWGWAAVLHPDDTAALQAEWQACLRSGKPMSAEARMRRRDGIYRWFLFLGNPLHDDAGNVVKWFGTNVDVEDRRRAEDALRASERALVQTINAIPTTAWSTRPDGYCDFLSDRWLDYAGFSSEEALGWKWTTVLHPDDQVPLGAVWKECLATGAPVDVEARMRRFDGEYRWFLFRVNPLRDAAGNILKWYGTNVDIHDRKKAEEAIQASERDLDQIINTIPTTAWSTLADGYCDFLSDRWLEYAGLAVEQAIGWNWSSVIHPDDTAQLITYWQRHLASGEPVDVEARMRRFDGAYRWFLFRANPLRDTHGNIVKWYGTNIDIDDRKNADNALRARERNLSLIINTIPMLAWSSRADGFCDFVNQRWIAFTGTPAAQSLGLHWHAAVHPDDRATLVERWEEALASGEPLDTEARLRRFDGEYRWFLLRGNPLHDDAGNIVRWYGTNIDIEDRKRAEEMLRRNELLLAEGQRVSQTGSFYWHPEGDNMRGSDELRRILGLRQGEPVSFDGIAGRVHAEDRPAASSLIVRAHAGDADLHCELRLQLPDASYRCLRINASLNPNQERGQEYVGAIQDVTQLRLTEQAIAEVRSELAYMTRVASMGVLTASIAHEVNQPLTGIIANGSTCLRMLSSDPPNVAGALETVRRTIRDSNRAADVITRLRALFSRRSWVNEEVDLNEATREVVALSVSELQRNRITLRLELAEPLSHVAGDRIQLQQVILNLLMNACAAMSNIEDRPRLLVIATESERNVSVRFRIRDNGVGIAPDHMDRIFDPFYSTKSNGLGIGLSVSRTIIESHKGVLWGTPNPDAGATFFFSIPAGAGSARRYFGDSPSLPV